MDSDMSFLIDDEDDDELAIVQLRAARAELERRCSEANIPFQHFSMSLNGSDDDEDLATQVTLKAGRDTRDVYCTDPSDYLRLLSFEFEKFKFIAGFDAIVNYEKGEIEAVVRHATASAMSCRMTATSLYPEGASHAGVSFPALLDHLVCRALARGRGQGLSCPETAYVRS